MQNGQFVISRGVRDLFLSEGELRRQARSGLLLPADRVYHPQLSRWLYASEVAEVRIELKAAQRLGQVPPPEPLTLVPPNGPAVAGLILGVLGLLPLVGLVLSGLGLYYSGQGLRHAQEIYGSGHRLAVAGLILSVLCFLPQLCLSLLLMKYGVLF